MSEKYFLNCRTCGSVISPDNIYMQCPQCGKRLEICYNRYDVVKKDYPGIWAYVDLLPVAAHAHIVSLGEGNTPLTENKNVGKDMELERLFFKNESLNPTWSFKDRCMSVGVSVVKEYNKSTVVTASSGNAAVSLAAYSAAAQLECCAFVQDTISPAKLNQLTAYGAHVSIVERREKGDPTVLAMEKMVKTHEMVPVPSFGSYNPYQQEGAKTISYEVCSQLCEVPNWVIVPVGSGSLLCGVWKGFKEFLEAGVIQEVPKLLGVQAEGCSPVVDAFVEKRKVKMCENPHTVASGLIDPYPWDGDAALEAVTESNGYCVTVADEEILQAQAFLASKEGIFGGPTGVVSVAGVRKAVVGDIIRGDELIVCLVTESGLKEIPAQFFHKDSVVAGSSQRIKRMGDLNG